MALDLAELGISREDLLERVIDRIVDNVLVTREDSNAVEEFSTDLYNGVMKELKARIDKAVVDLGDRLITPNVQAMIEATVLQETNQWGEKKGQRLTFTEYLVWRAKEYFNEKVDFHGKSKEETSYGSFQGCQTRMTAMIHGHLHFRVEEAMKEVLKDANKIIVGGIVEACKTQLKQISDSLKVNVETKR